MTVVCFPACLPVLLELERNPKNFRGINLSTPLPRHVSKGGREESGKRMGSAECEDHSDVLKGEDGQSRDGSVWWLCVDRLALKPALILLTFGEATCRGKRCPRYVR